MSFEEDFTKLVKEAFDENIGKIQDDVQQTIFKLREKVVQTAKKDFPSLKTTQLDNYVETVRTHDYLSELLTLLNEPKKTGKIEKINLDYMKKIVPTVLKDNGYVSAKLISDYNPDAERRAVGTLLSKFSKDLNLIKDEKRSSLRETIFIEARKQKKEEKIERKTGTYKPNMGYDYVWSTFRKLAEGKEYGVSTGEVLHAIIDEERSEDKIPPYTREKKILKDNSRIVGMVLGQLTARGQPIEKMDGKWRIKKYEEKLTKEQIDCVLDGTIIAAEKAKGDTGRWTAESVCVYCENKNITPEIVKRVYEQRINGETFREHEKIGMMNIRGNDVYFWMDEEGDFSKSKKLVYRTLAGHVCKTDEEEAQVRGNFRETLS